MSFASCKTVADGDAATLEAAQEYADALLAGGATPSGAAGGALTGTYPNPGLKPSAVVDAVEAGIAADTGAQAAIAAAIADDIVATGAFQTALAAAAPNLKTCAGAAMAAGANVPTCAEMNTAIAAAVGAGAAPTGAAGGALTGTYPNPGLSAAAVAAAYALKNCAGVAHAAGANVPSCAEMTAAIEDAIDALPGDKFLQGLQSYNAATNTMVLAMSDGTTVSIDMTALLNDAVASVTATPDASETVKGVVELATTTEAAAGTSTTLAVTPAGLAAAIAANATPDATDTVKGKVSLAVAANMPSTSDTEAATPAAVNAAIAANNTAMGATPAETIAGVIDNKLVSPSDLKAAAEDPIKTGTTDPTAAPANAVNPYYKNTATGEIWQWFPGHGWSVVAGFWGAELSLTGVGIAVNTSLTTIMTVTVPRDGRVTVSAKTDVTGNSGGSRLGVSGPAGGEAFFARGHASDGMTTSAAAARTNFLVSAGDVISAQVAVDTGTGIAIWYQMAVQYDK